MTTFKFYCLHCRQHIEADDGYCGQIILCPTCNIEFIVPAQSDKNEPQKEVPDKQITKAQVALKLNDRPCTSFEVKESIETKLQATTYQPIKKKDSQNLGYGELLGGIVSILLILIFAVPLLILIFAVPSCNDKNSLSSTNSFAAQGSNPSSREQRNDPRPNESAKDYLERVLEQETGKKANVIVDGQKWHVEWVK